MPTTTDDRMIALMRLVLALSGFLIVVLNRPGSQLGDPYIYTALTVYVLYSAAFYAAQVKRRAGGGAGSLRYASFLRWQHWIDIGYYTLLIWLSGGAGSPFYVFYFFAIIVAASSGGYGAGMRAVLVSALLLFVIGFLTITADQEPNLNIFLLRPVYLMILGYIIASLGGSELALRRRLFLLKDINSLSNPRFGIDRTLGTLAERFREYYDADKCVMAMEQWHQMEPHLRRALREEPDAALRTLPLAPETRRQLLSLPGQQTLWQRRAALENGNRAALYVFDHAKHEFARFKPPRDGESLDALAGTLEAEEFFSPPLCYRGAQVGRVFIVGSKQNFHKAEALFLMQAIEHVMPSLDNTLLLDRLASDAAEEERQRIARDLHDSIIQPYMGLRMGLTALSNQAQKDGAQVQNQVERLIEMTDMGIEGLYGYVSNLKTLRRASGDVRSSIERFVARFSEASTIRVQIEMDDSLQINDRLAAEVFQMISEGLSNVRRHTGAAQAQVKIEKHGENLQLSIVNEYSALPADFVPRSVVGRAEAMGGRAQVQQGDGSTLVLVTIPL